SRLKSSGPAWKLDAGLGRNGASAQAMKVNLPRQSKDERGRASAGARQPVYIAALAISLLWAAAPIAFAIGYRGQVAPIHDVAFALALLVLLAAGPAACVWGAAYLVKQG